ncbi:MAG: XdhC family protein [Pseudomonadota bacterium]
MTQPLFRGPDPIEALLESQEDAVLAVIAGTEGPAYRPLGTMMTIFGDGKRVGSLSSGCIEADLTLHAKRAHRTRSPFSVRYGKGSPFKDIELTCGGGLDILLVPNPNRNVLKDVVLRRRQRMACTLEVDSANGEMRCVESVTSGWSDQILNIAFKPELRFVICGKGPEASTFTALVQAGGYPNLLLSPDEETRAAAARLGSETRPLLTPSLPKDLAIDDRTALALFFHDHDWEPPILTQALKSNAFYIGAQGSLRARDARNTALLGMGIAESELQRIHGPVGLIPSARDPGTLAVSVLAEVLAEAQVRCA